VLGKPALSDLKEGKLTLPLILAMPRANARERELIAKIASRKSFDDVDPAEVGAVVRKYDALDETRAIARNYASRARAALEAFPSSQAKETLDIALDFVLDRDRIVIEAAVIDLAFAELRLDVDRVDLQDLVEEDHGRVVTVLFHRDLVAKAIERDQLVVLRIDPRAREVRQERGEEPVARN